LKKLSKNMILALDADTAGEGAMLRCVDYENALATEIRVLILPAGRDPDDVIKDDTEMWQKLLEEALPIMDYTINMVTTKLDLTTARDKSLAVDRLLPLIAEIQDTIRQAHYLQKLAGLVKVSERILEATLSRIHPRPDSHKVKKLVQKSVTPTLHPLLSSPVEEYCLALLLQHTELKDGAQAFSPENFENSENREIFSAWQQTSGLSSLKEKLDTAIWEHLDSLITKSLPNTKIEQKYADCSLRLREKFLRNLERKREQALAIEAASGGTAAELAKLEEQGIEVSVQLGEVFTKKNRRGQYQRS